MRPASHIHGMRLFALLAVLAAAPAAAQDLNALTQMQLDDLRAQQQLAQQRAVAQHNEMIALESQLRTEQAAARIAAQRAPVVLPTLPYPLGASAATPIDVSKLPSIPDSALADSNRRVQAITQNRR